MLFLTPHTSLRSGALFESLTHFIIYILYIFNTSEECFFLGSERPLSILLLILHLCTIKHKFELHQIAIDSWIFFSGPNDG